MTVEVGYCQPIDSYYGSKHFYMNDFVVIYIIKQVT